MKHLIKFSLFEEVNPKDIAMIESFSDYFTVAFEFEIETLDRSNIKVKFKDIDEDAVEDIIDIVYKDMRIRKKSEKDLVYDLMYKLYDHVEDKSIDLNTFEEMFDINKY